MSDPIHVNVQKKWISVTGPGTYQIRTWLKDRGARFDPVWRRWRLSCPTDITKDQILAEFQRVRDEETRRTKRKRSESMKRSWDKRKRYKAELEDPDQQKARQEHFAEFRKSSHVNWYNSDDKVDTVCHHCERFFFSKPISSSYMGCPHCGHGGP